jgi:hypothetical protein
LPFGVIVDQLFGPAPKLPISIEVNFKRFPEGTLLNYAGLGTLRSFFRNSLKEAAALLFGSAGRVLNMPVEQDEQLWEAVNTHSKDLYLELTLFFKDTDPSSAKYLPLRIVTAQGTLTPPIKAKDEVHEITLQELVTRYCGEHRQVTIQGVKMPLEASLWWCWQMLSHPDQFLYVVVAQ